MIKCIIITAWLIINVLLVKGQTFVSSKLLESSFNIRYGNKAGTCFTLRHDNQTYLVTAKHILSNQNLKNKKIQFEVLQDTVWNKITGKVLMHSNTNIDLVVLSSLNTTLNTPSLEFKPLQLIFGDDGFFAGFPFGLKTSSSNNHPKFNQGFPIPLIKKAVLSGFFTENNVDMLFLDGNNNPGFSGGAVVFNDRLVTKNWYVVGVISSYINQLNDLITPSGTIKYSENSGIIVAVDAKYILEIIMDK